VLDHVDEAVSQGRRQLAGLAKVMNGHPGGADRVPSAGERVAHRT